MKILFKVFPQKSHYNATFPLARALRDVGHEIIYAGLEVMQSHVEAQGFAYFVEAEDVFPHVENRQNQPKLTWWSLLCHWREIRCGGRIMSQRYARADAFDKLVRDAKPDLMLVDSPYTLFALSLYKHKIPFGMLESMMPLDRAPDCPPFDTTCVPTGTWLSRRICTLHWWRFYCKRTVYGFIGVRADANRRFVLEMARRAGVDLAALSFDRYFHIGLRDVPEFLLSPKALDFPRKLRPNQFRINISDDVSRQEANHDYRFYGCLTKFVAERDVGRPLVYCSLGTAAWRYPEAERFLVRVSQAAAGSRWNLILAVGTQFELSRFRNAPCNVAVFQFVPQIAVLESSDLMLTHGGLNSIAECMRYCVPMIVYPGNNDIDQAGNAARVQYQGIGILGCLGSATVSSIANQVNRMLEDGRAKVRLQQLRSHWDASVLDIDGLYKSCAERLSLSKNTNFARKTCENKNKNTRYDIYK